MSNLIVVSPAAKSGLALLMWIAETDPVRMTIDALADLTGSTYAQTARLLRILAKARVVKSTRGPGGGWRLSVPPHCISVLQVIEAFQHHSMDDRAAASDSELHAEERGETLMRSFLKKDEAAARRSLASMSLADALVAEASPVLVYEQPEASPTVASVKVCTEVD